MKDKNCFICKYRKTYFGLPYCMKTPEKPARLDSHPSKPKCYEEPDYRHNFTSKPKPAEKARIQERSAAPFIPGDCDTCILHIHHLNYCTAFGMNCNTFECYYKNKTTDLTD